MTAIDNDTPTPAAPKVAQGGRTRSLSDLTALVADNRRWRALAAADIRSRYRRTMLGPFWVTLSTAALVLGIGLIYGQFFGADVSSYMPYFMGGIIVWTFMSGAVNDAATGLIGSGPLIKGSSIPLVFHIARVFHRNYYQFLHNLIIVVVLWPFLQWPLGAGTLLAVIGFGLTYLCMLGVSIVVALLCVRYRDVPPMIGAVLQFLFFASPIVWLPETLKVGHAVLWVNPITYFLGVTRDPLIGRPVEWTVWAGAVGFTALSLVAALLIYMRYRGRAAYWL